MENFWKVCFLKKELIFLYDFLKFFLSKMSSQNSSFLKVASL